MESRRRHLLKALSWQLIAVTATFIIAFVITGEVAASAAIGGIGSATKFVLYYLHERFWSRVSYGVEK